MTVIANEFEDDFAASVDEIRARRLQRMTEVQRAWPCTESARWWRDEPPVMPDGWEGMNHAARRLEHDAQVARNRARLGGLPSWLRRQADGLLLPGHLVEPWAVSELLDEHERRLAVDPEYQARIAEALALDRQEAIAATEQRLESVGIPRKDIAAVARDALEPTQALTVAREWHSDERMRILVLAGPTGTGKTTAASWLAGQANVWAPSLVTAAKLSRQSAFEEKGMRALETAGLLVVDDIGAEYADTKGYFVAFLDALVNARYAEMRRTVLTTNLTAAQFKQRYGERLADRVRECGRFVELTGESLRRKKQEP